MFIQVCHLEIGRKAGEWVTITAMLYASILVNMVIEVPKGFKTDLASIPRLFQWLISVNGLHRAAAILHDYLYQEKPDWCTRALADQIFLEAMKVAGETWWRRRAMYTAVRLGGWLYWRECRKCKKENQNENV